MADSYISAERHMPENGASNGSPAKSCKKKNRGKVWKMFISISLLVWCQDTSDLGDFGPKTLQG